MRHHPRAAVALALAGFALAGAGALELARAGQPQRWPAGTIRVYDRSGWTRAVQLAAAQWNRARLGVRFQLVGASGHPDVTVVSDHERVARECARAGCIAFVTHIGYPGRGRRSEVVLGAPGDSLDPDPGEVQLVTHELGHILGLRHHNRGGCKVMNPQLADIQCGPEVKNARELCGPMPLDLRRVARLYGVPVVRLSPYCTTRRAPAL